jgi:hypothetical protein
VETTEGALGRVLAFGRAVQPDLPAVDGALAALRDLLAAERVEYVVVGGVAVVHHGYARTTRDVDVLLTSEAAERVAPALARHGFDRLCATRWRHRESGAEVDLLFSGDPIPPRARRRFPAPAAVARSSREPDIAGLAPLLELELAAGRHQDVADVVGLLQGLDEAAYLAVEAAVEVELRPRLAELRQDALEERRWRDPFG